MTATTNLNIDILGAPKAGSCRICGAFCAVTACRYWDCDDGWIIGKLCGSCAEYPRAPQPTDYAYGSDEITCDDMDDFDC